MLAAALCLLCAVTTQSKRMQPHDMLEAARLLAADRSQMSLALPPAVACAYCYCGYQGVVDSCKCGLQAPCRPNSIAPS
jgi:hypothetical protein